jgi:hypothetical protein
MLNAKFAIYNGLKSIVPILIIFSIFLLSLIPINDFDFWWHLKTGDYILENKKLPDTDPFSYTAISEDKDSPKRPQFILKQYWLGQVIFAIVVKIFGLEGFIIMRAVVFALIGLIAFSIGQSKPRPSDLLLHPLPNPPPSRGRERVGGYTLLLLLALVTTECLTDRPQMFSFLFAIVVIYIIEDLKVYGLRSDESPHCKISISNFKFKMLNDKFRINRCRVYSLPLIMLLWAQIHGGYLVGITYLLVYLIMIPFEEDLKKNRKVLIPIISISIILTYLNPTHWDALKAMLGFYKGETLLKETLEYYSPVKIIPFTMKNPGWLSYWALIGLSLIALISLFKKRSWSPLIILAGTAVASLISMRYTYFFAPVAVAIIPFSFNYQSKFSIANLKFKMLNDKFKMNLIIFALILAFTLIFTYQRVDFKRLLKSDVLYGYFPEQAAEYIVSRKIPGPIFNDVNWGGYLIWRLWPEYRVFIDTRTLNVDVFRQYLNVMNDYDKEGRLVLSAYDIKSIITPAINPYTGDIFPLVRGLYNDDEWILVYLDGVAMIFVRKSYYHTSLPKVYVYKQVLDEASYWRPAFPHARGYDRSMGEALSELRKTGIFR